MAMVIQNNMSAMMTLGELNKNNNKLGKQLKKVSSGMRINSAGDDASGYAISERMRVRIRGLSQCSDNTQTGKNMLQVAERAVEQQIDVLTKMREIALRASDDTYTQADRDVLQAETSQLADQLDTIAYDTTYNGRRLLCENTYVDLQIMVFNASTPLRDNDPGKDFVPQPVEPNEATDGGGYEITGYVPDSYNYLGRRAIYNPDETVQTQMSFDFQTGVNISKVMAGQKVYDSSGTAYQVEKDTANNDRLSVNIGGNMLAIIDENGYGYDNTGAVDLNNVGFVPYSSTYKEITSPNVGDSFVFSPARYNNPTKYTYDVEEFTGQAIFYGTPRNTDGEIYSQKLDFSWASSVADFNEQGFCLLCSGCAQFVNVSFNSSISNAESIYLVDESEESGDQPPECYIIGISDVEDVSDIGAALMKGLEYSRTNPNSAQNPAPWPSDADDNKEEVGRFFHHPIYLYEQDDGTGNKEYYLQKPTSPKFIMYNGFKGSIERPYMLDPFQDLYIQGDTKASSNTRIRLPNTTLKTLFPGNNSLLNTAPEEEDFPTPPWPDELRELSDYDREYYGKKYGCEGDDDQIRREKWRDEIWPYARKGAKVDGSCVRTREKAERFLADIDQALKYLLDSSTMLGAEAQRMDIMNNNIITADENTTASESTLRDADMAKEMVEYTKANVLAQAAQSMLAQANQNSSQVMSLLQ